MQLLLNIRFWRMRSSARLKLVKFCIITTLGDTAQECDQPPGFDRPFYVSQKMQGFCGPRGRSGYRRAVQNDAPDATPVSAVPTAPKAASATLTAPAQPVARAVPQIAAAVFLTRGPMASLTMPQTHPAAALMLLTTPAARRSGGRSRGRR